MTIRTPQTWPPLVGAQVWNEVCHHADGLAVGSTTAALDERGVPRLLTEGPTTVGGLRRRLHANPGYLHVAIRLLAD